MLRKRTSKIVLIRNSPFRPVHWRYDRIMDLLNANKGKQNCPIKGVDDAITITAFSFIRKWEHICRVVPHEDQLDALAEIYADCPALYHAYEVYQRPVDDYARNALEARILARQSDERIASCLRLAMPESIDWYEKLFFNVRDSLDSVDYISKQVIGPLVGTGTQNVTMQLSAKFFGYFCGEAMLEFM
jgi:hypothetical protein